MLLLCTCYKAASVCVCWFLIHTNRRFSVQISLLTLLCRKLIMRNNVYCYNNNTWYFGCVGRARTMHPDSERVRVFWKLDKKYLKWNFMTFGGKHNGNSLNTWKYGTFDFLKKSHPIFLYTYDCEISYDGFSLEYDIFSIILGIEDDYVGPQLEGGKVTLQFMEELIEFYKGQRKLHRKFAYKVHILYNKDFHLLTISTLFLFIFQILCDIDTYFRNQPSLIDISVSDEAKFTICGDIHGQFYDLVNIFKINGIPSKNNPYLFNGDFVDRGSFSVECIFILFGFKLLYPDHFFLSRGNHESFNMNQMYGFSGKSFNWSEKKIQTNSKEWKTSNPICLHTSWVIWKVSCRAW